MQPKIKIIAIVLPLFLLFGCQSTKISVLSIPKEPFETVEMFLKKQAEKKHIWQVPKKWQPVEHDKMHKAAFKLPGYKKYGSVLLTITQIEGSAGSLLANVNRWRGQLGLKPISAKRLKHIKKRIKTATHTLTLIDLKRRYKATSKKTHPRIFVVIIKDNGHTWFLKTTGHYRAIGKYKKSITTFSEQLKLPKHDH